MSTKSPEDPGPRRVLDESDSTGPESAGAPHRLASGDNRTGFFASAGWTILAAVVPPVGLIRSGKRALGWTLIGLTVFAVLAVGLGYYLFHPNLTSLVGGLGLNTLTLVGAAVAVFAVLWVVTIGYTHLKTRPQNPKLWQRAAGAVLVGLLAFAIAAPAAVGVRVTYLTASLAGQVFNNNSKSQTRPTLNTEAADPFNGRLNILVLGGDDGFGRDTSLGSRPDSVMVLSVNTKTGDTVIISLPRNLAKMPFPKNSPLYKHYPNGFYDGSDPDNAEYFLNAMYDNVPATVGSDVLGKTDNVGADVMKLSVGEALGLKIDYYVKINLDGFKQLIDALGGITVNINYRVPKGGSVDKNQPPPSWLEPGPNQHLNGTDALWYARGRYGLDDYSRMERQRCVVSAVIRQTNPQNVLEHYQEIMNAGKNSIRTDIQASVLTSALLPVAEKVKDKNSIKSIVFEHGVRGFSSRYPDFDMMRARVAAAINPPATASATPTATSTTTASSTPTATKTASASASASSAADDTADACAYNPK